MLVEKSHTDETRGDVWQVPGTNQRGRTEMVVFYFKRHIQSIKPPKNYQIEKNSNNLFYSLTSMKIMWPFSLHVDERNFVRVSRQQFITCCLTTPMADV